MTCIGVFSRNVRLCFSKLWEKNLCSITTWACSQDVGCFNKEWLPWLGKLKGSGYERFTLTN